MPVMGSGSFRLYLGIGAISGSWGYFDEGDFFAVEDATEWATLINFDANVLFPGTTGTADFFVGLIELFDSTPPTWDTTYNSFAEIPIGGITPATAQLRAGMAPPQVLEDMPDPPWGTVSLRLDGGEVASGDVDASAGELLTYTFPNIGLTGRPESLFLLTTRQMGVEVTAGAEYFGGVYSLDIVGTYDLIYSWWLLDDVDACGNEQTSHLALAGEAPTLPTGSTWTRFDPEDPDAAPTPTIHALEPNHGEITGGTPVTIRGEGFGDDAAVTFAGTPATSIVVVSQYEITVVSPAHAAGTIDVVVTNEDDVASDPADYAYEAHVVEVLGIEPEAGVTAGGTPIVITGRGFLAGASVTIGGSGAADVVIDSDERITAESPAHGAGTADVTVTNTDATTATLDDAFTFEDVAPIYRATFRTPSGGVSSGIRLQNPASTIRQHLGQPTAATFTTTVEPQGNQLFTWSYQGFELFRGTVTRKAAKIEGKDHLVSWNTEALDFTHRLTRIHPTGAWLNVSATTVLQQLIDDAPGFSASGVEASLVNVSLFADGTADLWALIVEVCGKCGAKAFLAGTTLYAFTGSSSYPSPAAVTEANPDLLWPDGGQAVTIEEDYTGIVNAVTVRGAEGLAVTVEHAGSIALYGRSERTINDNTLTTTAQLAARAQVELDGWALPLRMARYATRDLQTHVGATVAISMTLPPITGTWVIQAVTIDQLDLAVASPPTKPRFVVTCVPPDTPMQRPGDLVSVLQAAVSLKQNEHKQPKLDGAITSLPGGRTEFPDASIPASKLAGCIPGGALLDDTITTTQIAPEVFEELNQRGTRAAHPDAADVEPGTLYFVTDEGVIERSNGVTWQTFSGAGGGGGSGVPAYYDAPLTNGDPAAPEIVFDSFGDVVVVTGIPL